MQSLLLPDTLKLLPLYTLGLMKSALFTSAAISADERSHYLYLFSTMTVPHSTALVHPRLVQLHPPAQQMSPPPTELPRLLALTVNVLTTEGAYLLEDGLSLTLWLGSGVSTDFLQGAFGWPTLENVDASTLRLLPKDASPLAGYIHAICELLGAHRVGGYLALRVCKQGDGSDGVFMRGLIEDQTRQMMAYPEFLTHCHRFILSKVA